MEKIIITGEDLSLQDIVKVSRYGYEVELSENAKEHINKSRKIVDNIVENNIVKYGITTGFGKFSDVKISKEDSMNLQRNLIISHACGTGKPLSTEIVRAIMLLRLNALSKGFSGIRLSTLNILIEMINKRVHPIIPEKGSLGASGDLAPLAHMVLTMIGEGEAEYKGKVMNSKDALNMARIEKVELVSKEGLALINGTQVMTAIGAITLYDSIRLMKVADVAAALSLEALRGITDAYDKRIHKIRPHLGQMITADNVLNLVSGSTYVTSQGEIRVQDAYTLRCVPQVHGASKDAIRYIEDKVNIEINSVTDNPIITEEGDVISGGNFHGQPMAISFDFLCIALSEIANISERRLERLINYQLNDLPPFLVTNGGVNSGFMISQYAAAALVSENKILSHPASVDSIPSSANQEDHVSMGTIAARKASEILENCWRVISTEIFAACQAIDFRTGLELGKGTKLAYELVRETVPFIKEDVIMYKLINNVEIIVSDEKFINSIEKIVKLNY